MNGKIDLTVNHFTKTNRYVPFDVMVDPPTRKVTFCVKLSAWWVCARCLYRGFCSISEVSHGQRNQRILP